MEKDTVVGIVGALALVAVMVGVFIYEVNAADDDEESQGVSHMLDSDGDLDGDGVLNGVDDDVDGDGIPDEEDDMIAIVTPVSLDVGMGTIPDAAPPMETLDFDVEAGAMNITVALSYDTGFAVDAAGIASGLVQVRIEHGGEVLATAAGGDSDSPTGGTVTMEMMVDAPHPGGYTLVVEQTQPVALRTTVAGQIHVHY